MQTSTTGRRFVSILCGLMMTAAITAQATTTETEAGNQHLLAPLVTLDYTNVKLSDAVSDIAQRSQVKIFVSPELEADRLNIKRSDSDWRQAIKSLLVSYNHLAILDGKGHYLKVWITGTRDPAKVTNGQLTRSDSISDATPQEPSASIELPVNLWQAVRDLSDAAYDGKQTAFAPIQADPKQFEQLQLGQPVAFTVPQEQGEIYGVVEEAHSSLGGQIQVWSGPVDGSHETASFTITQGEVETYVTVATGSAIYEASFNRNTGQGQVVNEIELTKNVTKDDFIIPQIDSTFADAQE